MKRADMSPQLDFSEREAAATAANPFIHEINLTGLDKVKLYVLGVLVAPVRLLLGLLVMFLLWPVALLRLVGLRQEQLSEPITGWRKTIPHYLVYFLSRIFFFIVGFIRLKVKGRRVSPSEAPILVVAPHSSFFDATCMLPCGLATVLSRAENLNIPVIGALLRFNQAIQVYRCDAESRRKTVEEIKRRVSQKGRWPQILVFPEGTCGNRTALLRFKPGAFIAGVPVQPVLMRYPRKLDTTSWTWKGPGMLKVLWLTLSQPYTDVEVEFLPVYVPNQAEKDSPTLFANNVQKHMARVLGIPATTYEFEGSHPVNVIGQLKLPLEPVIWKVHQLLKREGFALGPVEDYADACRKGSWKIGLQELAARLNVSMTEGLECMFKHYDQDKDGIIDFREVVLGLAVRDRRWITEDLLELAFELYDIEEKGRVTEETFAAILRSLLGLPSLDVSKVLKEICKDGLVEVSLDEFRKFALSHPDYKKLFTSYMRPPREQPAGVVERHKANIQESQETLPSSVFNGVCSKNHCVNEDTASSNQKRD